MSLSQQVHPYQKPAPFGLIASLIVAALGGFAGGMLMEHGPTYLNVHVTQPILGQQIVDSELLVPMEEQALAPKARGAEARIAIHSDVGTFVVLQDKADQAWGNGPIQVSTADFMTTRHQTVSDEALPSDLRSWQSAPVILRDDKGYVCSGTISEFRLLEQLAADSLDVEKRWDDYGNGPLLVGRVDVTQGDCEAATWARHGNLSTPSIGRVDRGTKKLRREARQAFRQADAYRTIQKEYESDEYADEYDEHKGKWDRFLDGKLTIQFAGSPEQELVFVQAQVGECGTFNAQLGIVFARQDDGSLVALQSDNEFLSRVVAAADVDGDGDLDLLTQGDTYDRSLMLQADTKLSHETHAEVPIHYCRC